MYYSLWAVVAIASTTLGCADGAERLGASAPVLAQACETSDDCYVDPCAAACCVDGICGDEAMPDNLECIGYDAAAEHHFWGACRDGRCR